MKQNEEGWIFLELRDIIQINRLVRNNIDFTGFKRWYDVLSVNEQSALISTLCEYAHQAGFSDATYADALAEAELPGDDPLVEHAATFYKPNKYLDLFSLYRWTIQLPDMERFTVFKLFV